MYIDKYKKDDHYEDENGVYYEDSFSFITTHLLDFCGCGCPFDAAMYVKNSLQIVADLSLVQKKNITYEEWKTRKPQIFTCVGAEYFMWYYLDSKGFTEHGGSVPGWLTQKGIEMLSDLNELKEDDD